MTGNGYRFPDGIIPVGQEPPPMEPSTPRKRRPDAGQPGKAKGKAGERFAVLNRFVDFTLADLSRAEIAVWLILYRDTREGTARTAISDIARRAGCDRRTVFRAVGNLEKCGLLKIVHRGGFGRGLSRYRVRPLTKDIL
jgi:predicted DNA-binding transcriptional regulator